MQYTVTLVTRQKVLELYTEGLTVREIAERLNISTQRVYQQLKKLRDLGLIEVAS